VLDDLGVFRGDCAVYTGSEDGEGRKKFYFGVKSSDEGKIDHFEAWGK